MHRRDKLPLGRVAGLHGVRGWVKVFSYTDPRTGILDYAPWTLVQAGRARDFGIEASRTDGARLTVKLSGLDDRDAAAAWVGAQIEVDRAQLPETAEHEYYWADLIGLSVETTDGTPLGRVERLLETGANDVLVVSGERQRLIPWLPDQVIDDVDLGAGRIRVRWDPEF